MSLCTAHMLSGQLGIHMLPAQSICAVWCLRSVAYNNLCTAHAVDHHVNIAGMHSHCVLQGVRGFQDKCVALVQYKAGYHSIWVAMMPWRALRVGCCPNCRLLPCFCEVADSSRLQWRSERLGVGVRTLLLSAMRVRLRCEVQWFGFSSFLCRRIRVNACVCKCLHSISCHTPVVYATVAISPLDAVALPAITSCAALAVFSDGTQG